MIMLTAAVLTACLHAYSIFPDILDAEERYFSCEKLAADERILMDCGVDSIKSYIVEAAVEISGMRTYSNLGKTSWWLDWLDDKGNPYLRVSVRWGNGLLTESSFDGAFLQIDVNEVNPDGSLVTIASRQFAKYVNISNGVNLLLANYSAGVLRLFIGNDLPREAAVIENVGLPSALSLSGNRKMRVNYFSGFFNPAIKLPVLPVDSILAEIEANNDGVSGLWRFLDRDTDGRRSQLGGFYTLALLPDHSRDVNGMSDSRILSEPAAEYCIYYIDGAKVNGSDWAPGMLKGRLYATPFQNHYRLQWYDAEKKEMGEECFADITDGALLTLQFPLFGAKVRFAREQVAAQP